MDARPPPSPTDFQLPLHQGLCFYYWGLFDGHAGGGAAEMASRLLHRHIREQLKDLAEILQDPLPPPLCLPSTPGTPGFSDPSHLVSPQSCWSPQKEVTHESLVVGAIENAFQLMVSGWPVPAVCYVDALVNTVWWESEDGWPPESTPPLRGLGPVALCGPPLVHSGLQRHVVGQVTVNRKFFCSL